MTMTRQGLEDRMVLLTTSLRNAKESLAGFNEAYAEYIGAPMVELETLRAENKKLRQALAYHYQAPDEEWLAFDAHCFDTNAAGGGPPDEDWHWSECALFAWERNE